MHKIRWCMPERVIQVQLSGIVTEDELQSINKQLVQLLDMSTSRRVHIMIDTENIRKFPERIMRLYQTMSYLSHKRAGWTLITGKKSVPSKLFAMAAGLAGARFRQTANKNNTLRFLYYVDSTLQISFEFMYGKLGITPEKLATA